MIFHQNSQACGYALCRTFVTNFANDPCVSVEAATDWFSFCVDHLHTKLVHFCPAVESKVGISTLGRVFLFPIMKPTRLHCTSLSPQRDISYSIKMTMVVSSPLLDAGTSFHCSSLVGTDLAMGVWLEFYSTP